MKIDDGATRDVGRFHVIDTAKGIGILFVVFGHAWRGSSEAIMQQNDPLYQLVDRMIYAWHMPLFFFLSGLMFLDVVRHVSVAKFATVRVRRMLWPLVVWTWIFFGLRWLAGPSANNPVHLQDFPIIPLPPYEHLWFLWALFLVQIVAFGLSFVLRRIMPDKLLRWLFAALAVILGVAMPMIYQPHPLFGNAIVHFPFFIAGIAAGSVLHLRPTLWAALAALGLFGSLVIAATFMGPSVLLSLALVGLLWLVIARLDRNDIDPTALVQLLRYLGQSSMAIYLAHTVFSAAVRIGLYTFGINALSVHLLAATMMGVIGPLVVIWGAKRLRLMGILGL